MNYFDTADARQIAPIGTKVDDRTEIIGIFAGSLAETVRVRYSRHIVRDVFTTFDLEVTADDLAESVA